MELRANIPNSELHEALFRRMQVERELWHETWAITPCAASKPMDDPHIQHSRTAAYSWTAIWQEAEGDRDPIAYLERTGGNVTIRAAGQTPADAERVLKAVKTALPEPESRAAQEAPVSFWAYGPHGPRSNYRNLAVADWSQIENNYSAEPREQLAELMSPEYRPTGTGQLYLMHGEPGTGKTTAIRSLLWAWKEWCGYDYILDPDKFFGSNADYMMDIMLDQGMDLEARDRWKLLILEDAGELLVADAKHQAGAALGRFLNAVDGLIGQGLRVMVLVTTNEPVKKWHPAVTRPGRTAAQIQVGSLNEQEAAQWLIDHDCPPAAVRAQIGDATLADLYAIAAESDRRTDRKSEATKVGFA